jgi:hypothetical protein
MNWLKFAPLIFYGIEAIEKRNADKSERDKAARSRVKQADAIAHIERAAEINDGLAAKEALRDPEVLAALKASIDAAIAFENLARRAHAKRNHDVPESESD